MNRYIYYYDVTYKIKWEEEESLISLTEKELDVIFQWLKNCAVVLWEKKEIVKWIDDLEKLKVIKKNYFQEEDGEYEFFLYDENGNFADWIWWKHGTEVDVTNEILVQYEVRSWYYRRMWKVVLEENVLYVDNFQISRMPDNSKAREFLHLILYAREKLWSKNMSYDELKGIYKSWEMSFRLLKVYDISRIWVQDILWEKIQKTKKKTNIEFIKKTESEMALWEEK